MLHKSLNFFDHSTTTNDNYATTSRTASAPGSVFAKIPNADDSVSVSEVLRQTHVVRIEEAVKL
jgi:hypothetical protein